MQDFSHFFSQGFSPIALSVAFIALYTIPSIIISLLQSSYIKKQNKVVILPPQDFQIAKDYALTMESYKIIESVFGGIVFIFWVNFGLVFLFSFDFSTPLINQLIGILAFLVINSFISLPLESYKTLVLDKAFGFSKMSVRLYIIDTIKSLLMLLVLGGAVCAALIYVIESFASWWIVGFGVLFGVAILANLIYPTIIAPMFNKFTPLGDESLKAQITELMDRVGFKANGIFVMDASKRDGRLNAYFGGLGKSKRVVLFDTLLDKVAPQELLAILGHELAHFKHKDLLKNIAIMGIFLFVLFFIAGNLPDSIFGEMARNGGSTLSILILISPLITLYFLPIINFLSRKAEYEADEFGGELTNKADLASALKKLINENKAFPYSHKAYIFFYMSHPPLLERLRELGDDIELAES